MFCWPDAAASSQLVKICWDATGGLSGTPTLGCCASGAGGGADAAAAASGGPAPAFGDAADAADAAAAVESAVEVVRAERGPAAAGGSEESGPDPNGGGRDVLGAGGGGVVVASVVATAATSAPPGRAPDGDGSGAPLWSHAGTPGPGPSAQGPVSSVVPLEVVSGSGPVAVVGSIGDAEHAALNARTHAAMIPSFLTGYHLPPMAPSGPDPSNILPDAKRQRATRHSATSGWSITDGAWPHRSAARPDRRAPRQSRLTGARAHRGWSARQDRVHSRGGIWP